MFCDSNHVPLLPPHSITRYQKIFLSFVLRSLGSVKFMPWPGKQQLGGILATYYKDICSDDFSFFSAFLNLSVISKINLKIRSQATRVPESTPRAKKPFSPISCPRLASQHFLLPSLFVKPLHEKVASSLLPASKPCLSKDHN